MTSETNGHATAEEPFPSMGIVQPDETKVPTLARMFLVGVVATVAIVTAVAALFYQFDATVESARQAPSKEVFGTQKLPDVVLAEAEQELERPPHRLGEEGQLVAIPIAWAKQKVLAELNENPEAHVTGPIPPPSAEPEEGAAEGSEATPPTDQGAADSSGGEGDTESGDDEAPAEDESTADE